MKSSKPSSNSGVRIIACAELPTRFGRFTIHGISGDGMAEGFVALVRGSVNGRAVPLVRIHSQCLTGDVLASERCDCRAQLEYSLRAIARRGCGVLLYLPQEGRGIGLLNKLRAYELQDRGRDTVEANRELGFADDARDYRVCAAALRLLGVRRLRLLSNNPDKVRQLEDAGLEIVERVPCQPRSSRRARAYLKAKRDKMGHFLSRL
jgi:3,4-dihydroxy 2-butanone 4-phosphate synthase/GTP cyclohydrolase II